MTYTEDHIKSKLIKELEASHVEVVDESDGCGGKFSCVIVSEKFKGKPLLQRHRKRSPPSSGRNRSRMSNDTRVEGCLPSNIKPTGVEVNVSAPGKVILHGEHSVVYGKLALAASLGLRTKFRIAEISAPNLVVVNLPVLDTILTYDLAKLKAYLLDDLLPLTHLPADFNWELPDLVHHDALLDKAESFLGYTTGTIAITSSQQTSLKAVFYLLAGILGSVDVDLTSVLLESRTELNIGAGTGSSASFLVSAAAALVQYVKVKRPSSGNFSKAGYKPIGWDTDLDGFNARELDMICKWALYAEKIVHGTPSGIDNTICTYGSMVEFRKGLAPKLLPVTCPLKMLLINTNVPRETKKQVSKVAHLHERYTDLVENILRAMEDVAFVALQHVASLSTLLVREGDQITDAVKDHYEELGRLASINHNLLASLGVSHVRLDEAVLILAENGLKGKMTGAGGGGYAICHVPPYMEGTVVENAMKVLFSRGFYVTLTELGGMGVTVD